MLHTRPLSLAHIPGGGSPERCDLCIIHNASFIPPNIHPVTCRPRHVSHRDASRPVLTPSTFTRIPFTTDIHYAKHSSHQLLVSPGSSRQRGAWIRSWKGPGTRTGRKPPRMRRSFQALRTPFWHVTAGSRLCPSGRAHVGSARCTQLRRSGPTIYSRQALIHPAVIRSGRSMLGEASHGSSSTRPRPGPQTSSPLSSCAARPDPRAKNSTHLSPITELYGGAVSLCPCFCGV